MIVINPGRVLLPLQGRHLKWLNDGQSFLMHADDLIAVKLSPRCVVCGGEGTFSVQNDKGEVGFQCKCKHGHVQAERDGVIVPMDVQPLLLSLGWTVCCTDCGEPVSGDNEQTASRFTVDCACTSRVYSLVVH